MHTRLNNYADARCPHSGLAMLYVGLLGMSREKVGGVLGCAVPLGRASDSP